MSQDKVWADDIFIQATAWYLELDIKIITFTSTPANPFMTISGAEIERESSRPNLYVGYYPIPPNQHYQSLLPKSSTNPSILKSNLNIQHHEKGKVLEVGQDIFSNHNAIHHLHETFTHQVEKEFV